MAQMYLMNSNDLMFIAYPRQNSHNVIIEMHPRPSKCRSVQICEPLYFLDFLGPFLAGARGIRSGLAQWHEDRAK